jgi:hypothetical protein
MRRLSKVSEWPDLPLILAGLLIIVDEIALVGASVFAGFDQNFQNVEAFFRAVMADFSRLALSFNGVTLVPVAMLAAAVGILMVFRQPKPWRAVCETALVLFFPLLVWSACCLISSDSNVEQAAPSWFSWPIFTIVGSVTSLCLLMLYAVVRCCRQWLCEPDVGVSVQATFQSLSRAYHGQ